MVMINTMQELVDLDGKPIPESKEQNLTLGRVMSNALMQPQQRGNPNDPKDTDTDAVAHYQLALKLRDAKAVQPVMIGVKEAALLIKMVTAMGHKLFTAQVCLALDPPEKEGEEAPKERSKPRAVK